MLTKIQSDIKQDYYQQNFPNDGQRFVAWYLRNINLQDPNQVKFNITDGADDKQIDAIVIDEDSSTAYIIQGKFIGEKRVDAEPLREVLSVWVSLKNLVKLQETGNEKLRKRLVDLSDAINNDFEIIFELVTTGELTENAQKDLARFQEQITKDEDLNDSLSLVDSQELKNRYDLALGKENPIINFSFKLEKGKFVDMMIGKTRAVIAAVPLKKCIEFPGIRDGTLFQKNVRQSLGLNNRVNKSIKTTINSDRHSEFFFYHNGITAICNKMDISDDSLILKGLNVVNGCQSLNTIISCSERVKQLEDTYILFRFYEIPASQHERADKISISTNFQTAVKPRDLRSNDKRILNLKKSYEQRYPTGYFITKRGEEPPALKDKNSIINLVDFGKYLISWHSQRPTLAYGETKIFDTYFEQLFKRNYEYKPENMFALNYWMRNILKGWNEENPYGLNESLLAMKSHAPFHQLYAISQCFSIGNGLSDRVPEPNATYQKIEKEKMLDQIIVISANSLNFALQTAVNEAQSSNKVFSPQNWLKTKACLSGINAAISMQLMMLPNMPGGTEIKKALELPHGVFEYRWQAD